MAFDHRQDGVELPCQHHFGVTGLALFERLADADDRNEARIQRNLRLGSDDLVGLTIERATLGVANQHPAHFQIHQHARGNFAGVGAILLGREILGAEGDVAVGQLRSRLRQVGERGADSDVDGIEAGHGGLERRQQGLVVGLPAIHFPVAHHQGATFALGIRGVWHGCTVSEEDDSRAARGPRTGRQRPGQAGHQVDSIARQKAGSNKTLPSSSPCNGCRRTERRVVRASFMQEFGASSACCPLVASCPCLGQPPLH